MPRSFSLGNHGKSLFLSIRRDHPPSPRAPQPIAYQDCAIRGGMAGADLLKKSIPWSRARRT